MIRAALVGAMCAAGAAFAQDNPDEEWRPLPTDPKPPGAVPVPAPPEPADTATRAPPPVRVTAPRPVLDPNSVSMLGGRTLGFLTRGQYFHLGFPMIGLRLALGLAERFDLGIGFDSVYTLMNMPLLTLKVGLYRGPNGNVAAFAEGGWAFFQQRATADRRGPRWLTGRRNGNVSAGVIASYQRDHPRAARLFIALQYLFTIDLEPVQRDPLGGVPASVQFGHNFAVKGGAEMPLTAKTSFVILLGLDFHGRYPEDSLVMPVASVGLVTSI